MSSSASSRKLCGAIFDVPQKRRQLLKIEEQISAPDFWNNSEATQKVMQERKRLESSIADEKQVLSMVSDVDTLFELGHEGEDVVPELTKEVDKLRHLVDHLETGMLLVGRKRPAGRHHHHPPWSGRHGKPGLGRDAAAHVPALGRAQRLPG